MPGQNAASRAFEPAFGERCGRAPSAMDALVYDAIMVLGAAVQEVGPDRDAVRRWLAELGRDRPPYPGVTGPLSFPVSAADRLHIVQTP